MNNVDLIGRLTKDPEYRTSASGKTVTRFTLAVGKYGKNKEADFISCVAFGVLADNIAKYISKGRQIGLSGHISTGHYDTDDGRRIYTTDVVADRAYFLGRAGNQQQVTQGPPPGAPPQPMEVPEGFSEVSDDDIPF